MRATAALGAPLGRLGLGAAARGIVGPPHAHGTGWGGTEDGGGGARRSPRPRRPWGDRARCPRPCPRPCDGVGAEERAAGALGVPLGHVGHGATARGVDGPAHARAMGWERRRGRRGRSASPSATSAVGRRREVPCALPTPIGPAHARATGWVSEGRAAAALGVPLGHVGRGATARGVAGPPHSRATGWYAARGRRRRSAVPSATSAVGRRREASPALPTPVRRGGS